MFLHIYMYYDIFYKDLACNGPSLRGAMDSASDF